MLWLTYLVLFARFLFLGLASPIHSITTHGNNTSFSKRADWKWKLEDLNNEFKGIHWDHAFKDAKDCTPDQLDKIIFATRAAMWVLELPIADGGYTYTTAWDRYFGKYEDWLQNGYKYLEFSSQIQHNIMQASKYPRQGHRTSTSNLKKVHFTCNYEPQPQGPQYCETGKTLAITTKASASTYGAYTIAFCPAFFDSSRLKYIEERTNGKPKPPTSISSLDTYERTIIHEFMHVDIFKYHKHIDDLEAELGSNGRVLIYGESRCAEFARKDLPKPNPEVAVNADSYSWFFMYYWFDKKWGWSSRHDELRKSGDTDEETELSPQDQEIDIPEPSFPMNEEDVELVPGVPASCQVREDVKDSHGNPTITCEYDGGDEDDESEEEQFLSEGGCKLSAKCHEPFEETAVDPLCHCKCEGKETPLRDDRCAGFAGALPGRPLPP